MLDLIHTHPRLAVFVIGLVFFASFFGLIAILERGLPKSYTGPRDDQHDRAVRAHRGKQHEGDSRGFN